MIPTRKAGAGFTNAMAPFARERAIMASANTRHLTVVQSGPKAPTNTLG